MLRAAITFWAVNTSKGCVVHLKNYGSVPKSDVAVSSDIHGVRLLLLLKMVLVPYQGCTCRSYSLLHRRPWKTHMNQLGGMISKIEVAGEKRGFVV